MINESRTSKLTKKFTVTGDSWPFLMSSCEQPSMPADTSPACTINLPWFPRKIVLFVHMCILLLMLRLLCCRYARARAISTFSKSRTQIRNRVPRFEIETQIRNRVPRFEIEYPVSNWKPHWTVWSLWHQLDPLKRLRFVGLVGARGEFF
jgi:hypothetical protein